MAPNEEYHHGTGNAVSLGVFATSQASAEEHQLLPSDAAALRQTLGTSARQAAGTAENLGFNGSDGGAVPGD